MLTTACNQDKNLVRKLKDAATNVRCDTALERLISVSDVLVELVVERTTVHGNVLIGGAARLWQRLIHVSLLDGINGDNAPLLLRDILVSQGQWLEKSSFHVQVAGPRSECTRLIQACRTPVLGPIISSHPFCFQEMLAVLDPPSTGTDSDSDDDQSPLPPSAPPQRFDEWPSRKRVKRQDSSPILAKEEERVRLGDLLSQ